eukprot:g5997.t1
MRLRTPRTRTRALRMRLRACRSKELPPRPVQSYSVVQKQLKGEDVMFVINDLASLAPDRRDLGQWSVYAICDGHGGSNAAKFVRRHLGSALTKVLPAGNPPPIQSEDSVKYCERVRHALVKAFVSLHDAFSSEGCRTSGTTLSVSLVCGWLLTSANVADSESFLDLGNCILELTNCHKVDNKGPEFDRLEHCGALIKRLSRNGSGPAMDDDDPGRGPLRVWPGGIAMSRSIGDLECGNHILPVPHVRQIWIPKKGARLIMASDGLWDHITGANACKLIRSSVIQDCPRMLMREAQSLSEEPLSDDISILVLDLISSEGIDFSESLAVHSQTVIQSVSGYLRRPMTSSRHRKGRKLEPFSDVDGLIEYPNMMDNIVPEICDMPTSQLDHDDDSRSRNSSMASDNWDVCECSWDCSLENSSSWEKDDRDILDSAQNYVQAGFSSQNRKSSSKVKMTVFQVQASRRVPENERPSGIGDLLDTSMNASESSMATIHEPDNEAE